MSNSHRTVFADTSFWIALVLVRDQHHALARKQVDEIGHITTTEAVLLETANALSPVAMRRLAVTLIDRLREQPEVEIVPLSESLLQQAWRLYGDHADKRWSLTDCISFVVMRDRKIPIALTSDHHFEQAGFQILLRDEKP